MPESDTKAESENSRTIIDKSREFAWLLSRSDPIWTVREGDRVHADRHAEWKCGIPRAVFCHLPLYEHAACGSFSAHRAVLSQCPYRVVVYASGMFEADKETDMEMVVLQSRGPREPRCYLPKPLTDCKVRRAHLRNLLSLSLVLHFLFRQ